MRKHPWYAGETISVAIGQGPSSSQPPARARDVRHRERGRRPPTPHLFHIGENVRSGERFVYRPEVKESVAWTGLPRHRPGRLWRVVNQPGGICLRLASRARHVRQDGLGPGRRAEGGEEGPPPPGQLRDHGGSSASRRRTTPQIVVAVLGARRARRERRRAARREDGELLGHEAPRRPAGGRRAGRIPRGRRGALSVAPRRGPPPPHRPEVPPSRRAPHADGDRHGRLDDRRLAAGGPRGQADRFRRPRPHRRGRLPRHRLPHPAAVLRGPLRPHAPRPPVSAHLRKAHRGREVVDQDRRRLQVSPRSSRGSRSPSSSRGSSRTTTGRSSRRARSSSSPSRSARPSSSSSCSPTSASRSRTCPSSWRRSSSAG